MTTTLTSPTRETTDARETIEAARTPQDDLPANILASACPSRTVMRHLTDRWTPLIVAALSEQPVARFGELKAMIQGVSPKVLTQTLRSMERDGAGQYAGGTRSPRTLRRRRARERRWVKGTAQKGTL